MFDKIIIGINTNQTNSAYISVPFLVNKIVVERTNVDESYGTITSPYLMCKTDLIGLNNEFPVSYQNHLSGTFSSSKPITFLYPEKRDINGLYTFNIYDYVSLAPITALRLSVLISFINDE